MSTPYGSRKIDSSRSGSSSAAAGPSLGVGDERVDRLLMADREVVVEIQVAVVDGEHGASGVVNRRQRQLDPVVRHETPGPKRDRRRQPPQHRVDVLRRQAVLESHVAIGRQRLEYVVSRLARIVGPDRRVREAVGTAVGQQLMDVAEDAAELVRQDVERPRRLTRTSS